jgi:hypothetical protein
MQKSRAWPNLPSPKADPGGAQSSANPHPRLLYYSSTIVTAESHLPGVKRFREFFSMVNPNICLVDRNGLIRTPVRTDVLDPMPAFRPIRKTYEEICNERAVALLDHAESLDLPLYVFYSGGIDSTLVLISLIKNAKPGQLKRVIILLTPESVGENVSFYHAHIVGKFRLRVAITYPFLLKKKGIFVCGELNDQLFGSDITRDLSVKVGEHAIRSKYNRDDFFKLWSTRLQDKAMLNWYLDLLERLRDVAPMPLETNTDVLWWLNFSVKWQSVVLRILSYMVDYNLPDFDREFVERHFFPFFGTEDFQLWSMNNNDKKIRDTWKSYKWTAKDVIYDFTKDADYRANKTKVGSLYYVILHQIQKSFITSDFKMHRSLSPEVWYEPDNSFRD